jgi:UDP-N-acetylmuramoyl-tripeptide--D-alanyl-D-alanine ligase
MNRYIKTTIRILLQLVSQAILWRHKPIVVAITGSVGKTTTKDIVAHGLESVADVRKSQKNFNTDFGVPLAIIEAENPMGKVSAWIEVILKGLAVLIKSDYPKLLVLEVGTRFPGDIPRLAKWIKPDVSIITHIPEVPVHIEFFESRNHIVDEKSALAKIY